MSRGLIDRALNALADKFSKNFGTSVNLASYTSSNPYTFPSDGYVCCNAGAGGTSRATAYITDANKSILIGVGGWSNNTFTMVPVFVRKGMKGWATNTANSGSVSFVPFA